MRSVVPAVTALFFVVACGDDSSGTSGGGAGGGGTGGGGSTSSSGATVGGTSSSSSSASSSSSSASTTSSGGAGGAGGDGGAGGAGGDGGAGGAGGGTGGGANVCQPITVGEEQAEVCKSLGLFDLPLAETTLCTEDSGVTWPAKLVRIPVVAGNCLSMRADNVGSPSGADLFAAIVDPGGDSLLFDDEIDCAVENPDGYACPEGSITVTTSGDAWVIVGAWEGNGCPTPGETPFEVSIAIDGTDLDLTGADVCAADLLEVIP